MVQMMIPGSAPKWENHEVAPGQRMVLHKGGHLTTIEAVRAVPLPEVPEGSRYGLVPHGAVIDLIEERFAKEVGVPPTWTVATNKDGQQFFGIASMPKPQAIDLLSNDDVSPAVAVRNSLDKSTKYGLGIGLSLFLCDNLAISGSSVSFSRVHIGDAWKEIQTQTIAAMAGVLGVFEREKATMARLREHELDTDKGYEVIGLAMGRNILLPRLALGVVKAWRKEESRYGSVRHGWRLLQHMTEALQREPARLQLPKLAAAHDLVVHQI